MAVNWPASLQQFINEQSFSFKFGDTTIRTEVDIGPKKVRRRFTRPIDEIGCTINVDVTGYNNFYIFYNTTTNGGVEPFILNHPITGSPTTFRFMESPQLVSLGGGFFQITMRWEILP